MNSTESRNFQVISKNGGFWINKNGWTFNLAPPDMVKISLPPYVEGIGWFIREAAILKSIYSNLMDVKFSDSFFMDCDVRIDYESDSMGGWIYSVESESRIRSPDKKMWICPQMKLYYDQPPKTVYISIGEWGEKQ
jgi:hypothetical protein